MNSAQDPKSSQPAETERIQLLLSRQLDGDLQPEEAAELAAFLRTDFYRSYLAAMAGLRDQLKALPVKRVSASFVSSVHAALQQSSTMISPISAPKTNRGWIIRGIVAVSVTACAATLLLLQPPRAVEVFALAGGMAPISPESDQRLAGKLDIDMSVNIAAADEVVTAKVAVSSEAQVDELSTLVEQDSIVPQEEMRPFIENDKWSIVVVTVNSKDREEVMRIIESLVAKHGMDIQAVVGNDDHDARFGVLFTSTGVDDKAFIDSVISETNPQSADWNPRSVADSTRESLIRGMQESMKTPTHSELHFGQVYMTLPKSTKPLAAASESLVAQSDAVEANTKPLDKAAGLSVTAKKVAVPPAEVSSVQSARAQKTPILVVFEFTDKAPEQI
jgi:predicted regulator of amino acid metabolism with ACT domain